jgi:hypothetical protein
MLANISPLSCEPPAGSKRTTRWEQSAAGVARQLQRLVRCSTQSHVWRARRSYPHATQIFRSTSYQVPTQRKSQQ